MIVPILFGLAHVSRIDFCRVCNSCFILYQCAQYRYICVISLFFLNLKVILFYGSKPNKLYSLSFFIIAQVLKVGRTPGPTNCSKLFNRDVDKVCSKS